MSIQLQARLLEMFQTLTDRIIQALTPVMDELKIPSFIRTTFIDRALDSAVKKLDYEKSADAARAIIRFAYELIDEMTTGCETCGNMIDPLLLMPMTERCHCVRSAN